jgi:hypothetical protein
VIAKAYATVVPRGAEDTLVDSARLPCYVKEKRRGRNRCRRRSRPTVVATMSLRRAKRCSKFSSEGNQEPKYMATPRTLTS